MKIERFDKHVVKAFISEVNKAIEEVAKKHGVETRYKGGRYDSSTLTAKVEFFIKEVKEKQNDFEFKNFAKMYGAEPEWLGKTFTDGRKTFKVVGLLPNRRKNCMSIQEVRTGKKFVCAPSFVRRYIA